MSPKRVVADTNIYLSAIIFGGLPDRLLDLAKEEEIELYTSKAILLELSNKLRVKFHQDEEFIKKVLVEVTSYIKVVEPKVRVTEIKSDPTDNIILEAALEANADFIVSGDKKHLLSLGEFKGIKIVSSASFLKDTQSPNP